MMIETDAFPDADELVELYGSVGWSAYTRDPGGLVSAVANSTYVAALRDGERLVGIVRGLSDDVSILYVQDVRSPAPGSR
ncbi:MAG: hypothetical protein ABFS21_09710, partial [Actinomycetota bacterium]